MILEHPLDLAHPALVAALVDRRDEVGAGQWADLPLTTLVGKASAWGFDGLELACIWQMLYSFLPNDWSEIERGYHCLR
ncbi:MAG: hypothetical protein ACLPZR_21380 [Solirubrobacteraceae bacterium]